MSVLPVALRPLNAVQSTDADGVIDIGGELAADQSADIIRNDIVTSEPEPPPPEDENARVLTAPNVYEDIEGPLPAAGSRGLVGSTPESDQAIELVARNGQLVSDSRNINLPDITGGAGRRGTGADRRAPGPGKLERPLALGPGLCRRR